MPTSYTSLLGLALPVTGELSGTWGDTVNDYITQYLDASVAGTQTISGSQTAVTLSKTTATSLSQAGSGATGSSQYNIINCTGNPASMLTVTVPAASKTYVVVNATSTNQDVKIVGAGPTTGVTLVAGEKAVIAWNGSDFIKVATSTADGVTTLSFGSTGLTPSTATSGAVTVAGTLVAANGGTGQSSYTTGDLLYATGSTALSKLGIGTNGQILTSTGTAPQWSTLSGVAVTTFSAGTTGFTPSSATSGAITLAGTLATTNGGTGLTSFTANGVVYASSTSALTTGSALTFDGTNLGIGVASPTQLIEGAAANPRIRFTATSTGYSVSQFANSSGSSYFGRDNSAGSFFGIANGTVMFSSTNDPLGFFLGTNEQMRLTTTGLGIGTSSPGQRLTVAGNEVAASKINAVGTVYASGAFLNAFSTAGGNEIGFAGFIASQNLNTANRLWMGVHSPSGANQSFVGNPDATPLAFWTNSVERMRITSAGDVGIGTSSPSQKLHVVAAGGYNATFSENSANNVRLQFYVDANETALVGGYNTTAKPMTFYTGGSLRATLDSSGNLGLGVTPSAWGSGWRALQIGALSNFVNNGSGNTTDVWHNGYVDTGGNVRYLTTAAASFYRLEGNTFKWFNAPSGTAGNAISFTQALTLDGLASVNQLALAANGASTYSNYRVTNSNSTAALSMGVGGSSVAAGALQNNAYVWNTGASALSFGTSDTERARITSGGNLLVGTTTDKSTALSGSGNGITIGGSVSPNLVLWDTDNAAYLSVFAQQGTDTVFGNLATGPLRFYTDSAERARITSGGNVSIGGSADRGTTVGSAALQLFNGTAPAGTLTNGVSLYSQSGDLRFMDAAGNAYQVGFRNVPQSGAAKTGSYTLATTDVGEFILINSGGSIVVPTSTFSAGDVVSLFNNTTGNITITCSAPTAYIAGANTVVTSVTLATRGVATVLFITATLCVITGNVS